MLAASLERYSKHPLAESILLQSQQERLAPSEAAEIREKPGEGLRGTVASRQVQITSRNKLAAQQPELAAQMPPLAGGLECVVVVDGKYAAVFNNDGVGFDVEALEDTRLFIGSGEPLNEKVASHGPFVMNNETELLQAFRDYQIGKMGILIED
jgi:redox-sensitive bicupin YhaK (pirin superfamily)